MRRLIVILVGCLFALSVGAQSTIVVTAKTQRFAASTTAKTTVPFKMDMNAAWVLTLHCTNFSRTDGYMMVRGADYVDSTFVILPGIPTDSIAIDAANKTVVFQGDFWSLTHLQWFYRNAAATTGEVTARLQFRRRM